MGDPDKSYGVTDVTEKDGVLEWWCGVERFSYSAGDKRIAVTMFDESREHIHPVAILLERVVVDRHIAALRALIEESAVLDDMEERAEKIALKVPAEWLE